MEAAVALAAFIAGHPITWKETGDLARALLAGLAGNLDEETFQAASRRLEGCEVRELTSEWLADYEAKGTAQENNRLDQIKYTILDGERRLDSRQLPATIETGERDVVKR